ncbi:hypothetical protein ACVWXM_009681 [Bradyrhizobium sp. GM7.3]
MGGSGNGLLRMHPSLEPVKPASQAIARSVQMPEAGSRATHQKLSQITIAVFAEAKQRLFSAS